MPARAAVILAAGQGTRMRSPTPKVLHRVGGRAMLDWAIDAAEALGCEKIVVVVAANAQAVRAHVVGAAGPGAVAVQDPPLGTGHAVLAAKAALAGVRGRRGGQLCRRSAAYGRRYRAAVHPARRRRRLAVLGFEAARSRRRTAG